MSASPHTEDLLKVRVELTCLVDRTAWEHEYGVEAHMVGVIRDDVKRYVQTTVASSAAAESGSIVEVVRVGR